MSILTVKGLKAVTEAVVKSLIKEAVEEVNKGVGEAKQAAKEAKEAAEKAEGKTLSEHSVVESMLSTTLLGPVATSYGLRKLGSGATEAMAGNAVLSGTVNSFHEFAVSGELVTGNLLPFVIPTLHTGETLELVEIYALLQGGSATITLDHNGSPITGATSIAVGTALDKVALAVTLAALDTLVVDVTATAGEAKGLVFGFTLAHNFEV